MSENSVGRPSQMNDRKNREKLAHLAANGTDRREIASVFGVHPDTVSRWTNRPDIQALISQENQQRINRIVAKIDTELEQRLKQVAKLEVEDIIKIRREMLPHRVELTEKPDEAKATMDLLNWFYGDEGIPGVSTESDDETGDV